MPKMDPKAAQDAKRREMDNDSNDDEDEDDAGLDSSDDDDNDDSDDDDDQDNAPMQKGLDTIVTDDQALIKGIASEVMSLFRAEIEPRFDALDRRQNQTYNRALKVSNSIGAAIEQNNAIQEEVTELRKALKDAPTILKALQDTQDTDARQTPATRKPQPGKAADVKMLSKGAPIADPLDDTGTATLSGEELAAAQGYRQKAVAYRNSHNMLVEGHIEFDNAANGGFLQPVHVEMLRKGLEDAGVLTAA